MALEATLRREITGPTGGVHPIGEVVQLVESQLFSDVKFEDSSEERLPNESLRTECEVPGCTQATSFVAPGYWCREHWTEWNALEREEDKPWMKKDRERPAPVVAIKETGVPVTVLKEWLLVFTKMPNEEIQFQIHREDLSIPCEREGCSEEAGTWQPAYLCNKDWDAWCDGEFKLPKDEKDERKWQKGLGAGRPDNFPELSPREQWGIDKRLGILDDEW